MSDPAQKALPSGYVPVPDNGRFTGMIGPFHQKIADDGTRWRGLYLTRRHCNGAGIVHGGFLMSLADSLLGHAIGRATRHVPVTMRLTAEFASVARAGDWIEGYAALDGVEDANAFGRAHLFVDQRRVFLATAVFRLMNRPTV